MNENTLNIEKIVDHWISRSDSDFETMNNLMKTKDFHWALFIGHLVIERLLKAIIVKKTKTHAPFTHDLRRLALFSELLLNEEQRIWLDTISTFNLNARYDDYKEDFYRKCNSNFAEYWVSNITNFREWIKTKL